VIATCPYCCRDLGPLEPFHLGPLFIDKGGAFIWWGESPVPLTGTERLIVTSLARADGAVVRRFAVADLIGSESDDPGNLVAVHLSRIRAKFRAIDPAFDAIENVHGQGLRWRTECSAS
jgi:two-component system OmpR family response regulator